MSWSRYMLLFVLEPIAEPPYIHQHHQVCTYSRIRHMMARLPGCQPDLTP